MKFKLMQWSKWLLAVAILAAGMMALSGPAVTGEQVAQADRDEVQVLNVPPALTAKWWQWALGTPVDENGNHPLLTVDPGTWDECGAGQSGKVWFLGGTFNDSGVESRDCAIPAKKRILFPLVNTEVDEIDTDFFQFICDADDPPTLELLRDCAAFIADQATDVTAIVDGENLVSSLNKNEFRVMSPPFKFDLPENDLLGLGPTKNVRAVSDGYWVLLAPLPEGEHEIVLGGTFDFSETLDGKPFDFEFTTEVTYHIIVMDE